MIPSKLFGSLNAEFSKEKSSSTISEPKDKLTIIPNVCGFRERPSGASSFAISRKREVIPTETNDFRHTEGYHEIYARDKLSSKYIYEKNKKIKLKKPEEFAITSFNIEEERYKSLDEIISKTTKFGDFIEKLKVDEHELQDLGCIEDVEIGNPVDAGDIAGKCNNS